MSASTSQLKSYAGPLTYSEIVEGIMAAQANASHLIDDARILLDAGRFPSASALAILAMEERGKVTILRRFALLKEPAEIKATWKEYRSHRAKNAGWILPEVISQGARTMMSLAAVLDSNAEHTWILDGVKQVCFYTDCLGERNWNIPEQTIDESLARSMITSATLMWGERPVSLREIELWGDIVGPHYRQPEMMNAVLRW